jgi:hypothetical protein
LGERWRFHYMAPVAALLAAGTVPVWRRRAVPLAASLAVALVVQAACSPYLREAWAYWRGDDANTRWRRCPDEPERQAELDAAEAWVAAQPGRLLASSNLACHRLLARDDTFVVNGPVAGTAPFDLVFFERLPGGGFFQDVRDEDEEATRVEGWRRGAEAIYLDTPRFFVARGRFRDGVRVGGALR